MSLWPIAVVLGTVVVADHLTKLLAVRNLRVAGGTAGILRLVSNERLASAVRGSPRRQIGVWLGATACAAGAVAVSAAAHASPLIGMGVAAAIAGAASNLVEALVRGRVIDFIAVGWWPVFNLADVAIVVGAVVAALALV